jgi:hypothetical protein
MKKYLFMMMAAVTMVAFVACGDDNKEDDEPITVKDSRITQVIPNQYLKELQKHMAIYDGVNPPNVEGVYLIAPALLHYDSYNAQGVDSFSNTYIEFYAQDMANKTLRTREQGGNDAQGTGSFISGEGNDFTVFLNNTGNDKGISFKTATVISGTVTSKGIKNLYYGFLMLEKGDDPEGRVMDPGRYRIIKDGDGLSEYTKWPGTRAYVSDFERSFVNK